MIEFINYLKASHTDLDAQHEGLFSAIEVFYHAHFLNPDKALYNEIYNELSFYCSDHFSLEEKLMEVFHYPDLECHKADHKAMFDELQDFNKKFTKSDRKTIGNEIMAFIRDRLISHIKDTDKDFISFMRQEVRVQEEEMVGADGEVMEKGADCDNYRTSPICVYNHMYTEGKKEINFKKLQALCNQCKGDYNYRSLIISFIGKCSHDGRKCWIKESEVDVNECTTNALDDILKHCCTCTSAS